MAQNQLYFGYGSNLDWNDWVQYCEKRNANPNGLKEREPAWLIGHHLKFHYHSRGRKGGAADVVPISDCHATPGALFDVDPDAWSTLVAKEGAPWYYEEKDVLVIDSNGQLREAITFVVCDEKRKPEFQRPTEAYHGLIHNGLHERGLPVKGLEMAMQHAFDTATINHLFVYGTLMSGQSRFNQLESYVLSHQEGTVRGRLHHLGNYPGMKLGDGFVHGQLMRLDNVANCLERMDQIEGFLGFGRKDSLFDRTIVQVETSQGKVWAWTYIYARDVELESIIEDGRWT
ncbi:MAG: gamma-glutamylcyclotransferase [Candidatus Poseidoniaceae archaeon]